MTTRDTNWAPGTPCWVDLGVDDFGKGQAFYSTLLGWHIEPGPQEYGGYATCTKDGRSVAGLSPKMDPSQPTVWTTYLATEDAEATLASVRDHGGQVASEAMDVGDMGRMAICVDPGGAFVGLWQGGSHTGFQLANEPGAVVWNENYSADWQRNRDFYAAVFGYTYQDMPMEGMEYATAMLNGESVAGFARIGGSIPEETPPHWNVYFAVSDVAAALGQVRDLGGSVMGEPIDTEYGRMAMVADDQGAMFWLGGTA